MLDFLGFIGNPVDFAWKAAKVGFALSPLIGIVALVIMAYDDPDKEKSRRKKNDGFQLSGNDE